MVLHWLLVINLSVFATKLAAFVLVRGSGMFMIMLSLT